MRPADQPGAEWWAGRLGELQPALLHYCDWRVLPEPQDLRQVAAWMRAAGGGVPLQALLHAIGEVRIGMWLGGGA